MHTPSGVGIIHDTEPLEEEAATGGLVLDALYVG